MPNTLRRKPIGGVRPGAAAPPGDELGRFSPREPHRRAFGPLGVWLLSLALGPGIAFAQDTGHLPKAGDWNRIHALSPGEITRVKMLKNEAPRGKRNVKGFFSSSTDTSITILFQDGTTRTIEKGAISTVRVRRPFRKRTTGWVIGISTAVITGYLYAGPGTSDITPSAKFIIPALITTPATVAGFFMMPTRLVYRAPRTS